MPIATPEAYADMIDRAKAGGFAYPAINCTSSETINAALKGFADAGSDGIIQFSPGADDGGEGGRPPNEKLCSTPGGALDTAEKLGLGERGRYLLAATFGNVHGSYKPGSVKLRPEILNNIQDEVGAKYGTDKPFDLV